LLISILGIFILVLRRLPQATDLEKKDSAAQERPRLLLLAKGLPAQAVSRGRAIGTVIGKKVWQFMLEAKGLKQAPAVNYKIKKMLKKGEVKNEAVIIPPTPVSGHDEQFYLDQIKKFPKDLTQYDNLGQFYIDQKNYSEAKDLYDYLTKHDPASSDYYAKLGYSQLHLRQFDSAVVSYTKSLELDSSHPNRYYNLALALRAENDYGAAAEALEKALALEPNNAKYRQLLAEVYHQLGESNKAREVSREIARIDSPSPTDHEL
jgi:tetratricopeptide (TPR) repeat protein